MTEAEHGTRSVVMERDLTHAPEKVWRALTQPHLIEAWLMQTDFELAADHRFTLSADWGSVTCQVVAIEPERRLSYTWTSQGLDSVVTWTLSPSAAGTHLRMEQSGFRPEQEQAYQGATFGWPRFLGKLEELLSRAD